MAILPAFLVRPIGESEPNFRESVALSWGTKFDNRFYGHFACISRPFYQGKVNRFAANPWHFPCPLEKGIPVFLEEELLFYRYEKILVFLTVG